MAHAKTMVIDGAATLQGSFNWTRGPAANSEDLNLISSPAVAAAYVAHWRQRLPDLGSFHSARGLVPGFVGGSALMAGGGQRPSSRPLTGGLRRVSVLVPKGSADGLRQLAREYHARHRLGMSAGGWRRRSPSAELMVDPRSGPAVRDPGHAGGG
jgi:phosphatidylserine/phosphatidylglycerophosphate/cardiolipin synthase-like enzyme